MLSLTQLSVDIQGSQILRDITLHVGKNELVCIVGRNGAGKTTIFRTVMGYLRPRTGSIKFMDESLMGKRPDQIAREGVGFAPEESEVFGSLTVSENIRFPTWTVKRDTSEDQRIDLPYRVFPNLREYDQRGGHEISGGERKMLSIARALALDAKLLLLDEPFEGLSPTVIPSISASIAEIRSLGYSIVMAESNIHQTPKLADRIYVIERGEIIFEGSPDEAFSDLRVMSVIEGRL